uniref:Exocyst subunit Exo70 family protein n=1 Tax=Oryza nivara TaxID=4536 RepID=A0A0E0HDH3_ORYNI
MARVLATVSELESTESADFSLPPRKNNRYLEKIRCLSVVSAGPLTVLERWFFELDVGWVLRQSADQEVADDGVAASRWMRGFTVMAHALAAMHRDLHDERSTAEGPMFAMKSPTATEQARDRDDDDLRLARFAEASVTSMLAFADGALLLVAGRRRPMDKLSQLMDLHSCISDVSEILMTWLEQEAGRLVDSAEMQVLFDKTNDVFSRTLGNLAGAIWRMAKVAEAVTPVLSGMDSCQNLPQNAEIHKDTHLIVDYARLFWKYQTVLEDVLRSYYSNDDPEDQTQYFTALIAQMITNLEQHLEKKSESFSDSSLRYMFLLNNSHFIQDQFIASTDYSLAWKAGLKHEQYQESYMLVSWEHVLHCLHYDKMPLWFPKHSSPVARFKSEFEKTCRHQKLWKVPNPKLRKSLREDIIDKVINGFKRYLEDHPDQKKCSSDQQDMEDMVNELFEG